MFPSTETLTALWELEGSLCSAGETGGRRLCVVPTAPPGARSGSSWTAVLEFCAGLASSPLTGCPSQCNIG